MDFVAENRLELLTSGEQYFPALMAAIDAASEDVYLETYIFEDDETGRRVANTLCRAAQRGVNVNLLVDGFGARDMALALREALLAAGVQLLVFRPKISPLTLRRQRLRRMHRKMAVADGRVAFVSGINIIDDANTPGKIPPRHDYAVRVEGPLVAEVLAQMEKLWGLVVWARLRRRWRPARRVLAAQAAAGTQRAALVIRDNLHHRADIEEAYLGAIDAAREDIIIANAYFFPGLRFRRALTNAATRGVRVTLLLQGRVEYLLLHYASRALYGSLLAAGVQIHQYTQGFLHAKVAVCDGRWATVGSSNIDPFSLLLAREANVVVDDRNFAEQLRGSLRQVMEKRAEPVHAAQWRSQSLLKKMPSWIAYQLVRVLMGLFGYGNQL
ncbi:MAG: cardiolipin synthase B [Betaproteobacteria bacterium RIFCSPLOWO2_02_FULL_62_17]|nr:MAG: cardiolipin synthase B [Betaproteobacteria bacterium RIFCSPLOWO2_02_FULL_62_17]